MKKCNNCGGFALYEDQIDACPVCGDVLTPHTQHTANYSDSHHALLLEKNGPKQPIQPFDTRIGNCHTISGIVTEITPISRYQTRFHKIINSVFKGEPYQFGYPTLSQRIRVEEVVYGRIAENVRDIFIFGDFEGRLQIGSDVTIKARQRGDRLVAKYIFLHDTNTRMRPGAQLPSWLMSVAFMIIFFGFAWFLKLLFDGTIFIFISSFIGSIIGLVISIVFAFLPLICIVGILIYMCGGFKRK